MVKDKYLNSFFIRSFISIVILIVISPFLKNDYCYNYIYKLVHDTRIDYSYINSKTRFILGNILGKKDQFISSNKLIYRSIEPYENGYKLYTELHYVVNNIKPGTVIYIGAKEGLGNTVIVEGEDGICYWYSSLENISVNLYDYIDSKRIIGSTIEDYLILTLSKDNEYLAYED